jgi:hypothetical protein
MWHPRMSAWCFRCPLARIAFMLRHSHHCVYVSVISLILLNLPEPFSNNRCQIPCQIPRPLQWLRINLFHLTVIINILILVSRPATFYSTRILLATSDLELFFWPPVLSLLSTVIWSSGKLSFTDSHLIHIRFISDSYSKEIRIHLNIRIRVIRIQLIRGQLCLSVFSLSVFRLSIVDIFKFVFSLFAITKT